MPLDLTQRDPSRKRSLQDYDRPAITEAWRWRHDVKAREGVAMVRHRMHLVADLGKYRDAIAWVSEINGARRKLGLPEWKAWSPVSGDFNYLILEADYADLGAYSAGLEKFQSDPQTMNLFRRGIEWGSRSHWPKDEVLESAPTIA